MYTNYTVQTCSIFKTQWECKPMRSGKCKLCMLIIKKNAHNTSIKSTNDNMFPAVCDCRSYSSTFPIVHLREDRHYEMVERSSLDSRCISGLRCTTNTEQKIASTIIIIYITSTTIHLCHRTIFHKFLLSV